MGRVDVELPLRAGGTRKATLVEGPAGWGEYSPLPGYPCPHEAAWAAAEEAAEVGWPPPVRPWIEVNALLGPEAGPDDARRAVAEGHLCLKLKVGGPGSVERVAAVRRAVGPSIALRVDANGAWDVETAVAEMARLGRLGVDLVEQPVASIEDMAAVRRRAPEGLAVAADECVRTVDDARRLARLGAADAVVLKVQPLGGVRAALAVAEAARVPALVTSMMETSVGLSAGLALAAALPELAFACGLGTATIFEHDVVDDPLLPVGGRLQVRRPMPDPDRLRRFAVPA
ncbi:MAG: enolase C-terminal domain-like protein [Actinomycetota bacterium]|jgi:o-succinylbenzoate synthase